MNDDDLTTWGASGRVRTLPLPSARRGQPRLVHDENAAVHDEALVILREAHVNDGDKPIAQDVYDEACRLARARLGRSMQLDDPLVTIRAEFKADDAPIDDVSGMAHVKATTILAASRCELTEQNYLQALHARDFHWWPRRRQPGEQTCGCSGVE
jgi:hypothetical protein